MDNNVIFYHHSKQHFNIGDYLCTPKHYFNFKISTRDVSDEPKVLIIGGGTYNRSFGTDYINKYNVPINIGWGLGVTINRNDSQDLARIDQSITEALETFDACSTRDIDISKKYKKLHFVPCVSVMNNIVEIQSGKKTGIFLNADLKRTSVKTINKFRNSYKSDLIFSTNAINEIEFRHLFRQTDKIITNSYHVAYWGFLSGRNVAVIGYSSKFKSLIKLFDLDENNLLMYKKNNLNRLDDHIEKILNDNSYYQNVNDHIDYISEFRKTNISYAETLRNRAFLSNHKIITQNENSLYKRTLEINGIYGLLKKESKDQRNTKSNSNRKISRRLFRKLKNKFF